MEEFENLVIVVNWEVEDGYMGKSRPQTTEVKPHDDMDFEDWEEMTNEEREAYLDDAVQTDFENRISYGISDYGL